MTTEENFFVRQDVTGFFTMLQGPRGVSGGMEILGNQWRKWWGEVACGVGRGVGLRGWWGFGPGARGVRGFGPRRGVGWDSDPGCGVGWGFRPERGVGIFWGKMGNFLPFCRFFAVWVEISGQWNLESLPFSGKNGCLGRDFRTAELGISTFFQQKPLFR